MRATRSGRTSRALVVARLRPRVGEEDTDTGEASARDAVPQQLDAVAERNADVLEVVFLAGAQQGGDAPAVCTSAAITAVCGWASPRVAVASPLPQPISTTTGRP